MTAATRTALAGLFLLGAWLLALPPAGSGASPAVHLGIGLLCAGPLVGLFMAGLRRVRQWGAWVAIAMIPYFTLALGSLLVAPGRQLAGTAFVLLTVITLFAGIAVTRGR